jgi:hypothetical protein
MKIKPLDCDPLFQMPITPLLQRVAGVALAASAGGVAFAAMIGSTLAGALSASEQSFVAENNSAMNKMMTDMTMGYNDRHNALGNGIDNSKRCNPA